ncbi:MAG TPA: ABC transporter substrate-binding protein [Gaiellaceae bacterium]|nr:ABC transporter substrate-binding protein [Gaiellaceae bacterium]
MAVAAGERRIVTVLFADIVGSTSIAERLGVERSKLLVDEVMRLMGAEVGRFEGTVAQYVGDELYAVFGAPRSHEDDSERAVRAALAIQRALERYAGEVREAYGVELAVRIAINTGPVVIQADSDDPYNALGDTVNVAARIQELADGGEVVVGRATKLQVESCFELESLGRRELKGVSQPVEPFRVVGLADESEPAPSGPLVGRDFELTVLERTIDGLLDGRGAVVAVVGEPGIGKTRLVGEVRERYRDRVRFVEGRAVSYAQSFPYYPIRDLLREWLGVGASTPEARVRLELKAQLAFVLGEEADDAYPFLASLLGLALEPDAEQALRDLNREAIQTRTFDAVAELLCRLSDETPLCVVLDDLHWADETTIDLLERLLAVTDTAAVALLLLYRTEREHRSWRLGERARQRFPHRYKEIELRPLPPDASRLLAADAAGAELPESVAELLAERAGGNPFFLEEALRDLVERGALQRDNGRYRLAVAEDELAVPALVQGALQARLDRLGAGAREVLSVAAVSGRTFGLPLLAEVLPDVALGQALSELQRLELVVETRRRPTPEYRFRHGLVQEVAYTSLVETRRRRLHLQVGEALERLLGERTAQAYALLGRHFAEADDPERAADYLLRAGDAARAVYADQEAVAHYERARRFLARLDDEERARETLFKIALARHVSFDFAGAEEAYDEAFCCREDVPVRLEPTERLETAIDELEGDLVPGYVYSTESATIVGHLFRGLLALDRDLNVVPATADNFRVSADGLTYLFRLREGASWSDGEPVTAEDFAWTWARMREEGAHTAFMLGGVEAEALDDRTLEVRLDRPRSYFPWVLASVWTYPWPRHRCLELGADWKRAEHLVSNGPYMLAERDDDHLLLVANPHYAGPRGNVGEIHVAFVRLGEELDAWRAGRLDVVTTHAPETEPECATAVASLGVNYVGFRADRAPFSNELVRKAFAHALDRERLVAGSPAVAAVRGGMVPPAMPGHSHRIALPYDLELARSLLADAGFPGGKGLPELRVLAHPRTDFDELAAQWRALGARVEIRRADGPIFPGTLDDVHAWLAGWSADYPDPDGLFRGLFEQGFPFHRDEEIDELLEQTQQVRDQGERMELFHRLDRLLVAERAAVVPVLYPRHVTVRRPWVRELWTNPLLGPVLDAAVVSRGS